MTEVRREEALLKTVHDSLYPNRVVIGGSRASRPGLQGLPCARIHNILEVRLLHLETRTYSKALEETVRELERSREVVRLETLEERRRTEQGLD